MPLSHKASVLASAPMYALLLSGVFFAKADPLQIGLELGVVHEAVVIGVDLVEMLGVLWQASAHLIAGELLVAIAVSFLENGQ